MSKEYSRRLVEEMMMTEVVTIEPTATLREAMMRMRGHNIKSLVVKKRSTGDAWGIVTYTTLLRTIIEEEGDVDLINVYDVASKPALTIPGQLEVRHAVSLMLRFDIKRLVVTRDNELAGILTMHDVVAAILEKIDKPE
ncbi:MAG: CBS domain-containing protein [Xanthomonadales bacterium]|nr:CBS domain-containing protein [Xanthomonadales bacterium]